MTVEKILRETTRTFLKNGFETATQEAEQLLATVLNKSWSELHLEKNENFPTEKVEMLSSYLNRRIQGEPLAYILGIKHFYKYDFHVNPAVLIPRPESELIIEKALELFKDDPPKTIFDVGSGSGCLGLSLAKEFPQAEVHFFDISEEAIEIAKKNCVTLNLQERCFFHHGEVTSEPQQLRERHGKVDLIVANPPYVSHDDDDLHVHVRDFEPHVALYANQEGLECLKNWSQWSRYYLAPKAIAIFEFGCGQKNKIKNIIKESEMKIVDFIQDYSQMDRHIIFKKE